VKCRKAADWLTSWFNYIFSRVVITTPGPQTRLFSDGIMTLNSRILDKKRGRRRGNLCLWYIKMLA